ncbi:Hint domain-containing protein [Xinfangfangia sp. D13-10-4-6]|uniref:Hint domain-containing protein n=1 Tax=Pseudogemmobacter hezensis TaxID=2737662 RepID=UPI00155191C1|nr:Hint domain-containing protein [Pseudogemmobacter hezensis]NPD15835.1 Hint domain-containing protein [Pseudogemmobacter hezensis]
MIYSFNVYSNHDIGRTDQQTGSGEFTVSASSAIRTMQVLDDDPVFDDESGAPSNGLPSNNETYDTSQQVLAADIDDRGLTRKVVQSIMRYDIVNKTTGETGYVYLIRIYNTDIPGKAWEDGRPVPGYNPIGPLYHATTVHVSPGDEIEYLYGHYSGTVRYDDLVSGPPICFRAGTMIATPQGERPAEQLSPGDEVMTRDGIARVLWHNTQRISLARQIADERLRPIRIAPGALGHGMPTRELMVSQQHRVLVSWPGVRELCDSDEVLVPACHLVGRPGITRCEAQKDVTYVHFLCERHEIVFAEGAPAETLLPGPEAIKSLSDAARHELEQLVPDYFTLTEAPDSRLLPAAPIASGKMAKALAKQHGQRHDMAQEGLVALAS